jgi:hypothetical protein
MRPEKFHGRHADEGRDCEAPGCGEAGEFRAPGTQSPGFDGPGEWRWLCLEHVREFNAGYDWFEGMTADEILAAQSPIAGWERETRAFRPGAASTPRWAEFDDPLDAIGARASEIRARAAGREKMARFAPKEREALEAMGLGPETDLHSLRKRYSTLVRRYHPDRNGGDRSHEARLQRVVEAYQLLRKAAAFA